MNGRMVQSTDGYLYGSAGPNYATGSAANCASLFRVTTSGLFNTDYQFFPSAGGSCTITSPNTMAEGPDQALYSESYGDGATPPFPMIFRRDSTGQVETVYTFSAASSGQDLHSPPVFGSDGNLYGAAPEGGDLAANAGTLFQLTPSGTFTLLHTFLSGPDGGTPTGVPLAASDGSIQGVTSNARNGSVQGLFKSALNLPAPIQLSFTTPTQSGPAETAPLNASITLNWQVLNAFSLTLQQCYAFAYGPPQTNTNPWYGKQTGTYANNVLSGSMTFMAPNVPGTYLYALTCGGVESGNVSLSVGNTLEVVTTSLVKGEVSTPYSQALRATGGTLPYQWGASGKLPDGLIVDETGGFLMGTPTQFGTYQVTIGVQDSSPGTPLQASITFPLTIDSGLQLSPALPNSVVGTAYNNTATASGGLGPYKWTLGSGKLPDGLTLNATSGVIFGTPNKAGKFSFVITLQDGEGTPAMVTQAYTIATNVQPLAIVDVTFPTCTVGVLCQGQFTATGGIGPFTWSILSYTTFPPGLTLNPDGSFTGYPTQSNGSNSPFELQVQVTDSETPPAMDSGLSSLSSLTVLTGLKIVSVPLPTATIGMPYQAPPPVASGGIPPYTWTISSLDPQVKYEFFQDPDGALRSAGPVTPGTFDLTYVVSDSEKIAGTLSAGEDVTVVSPMMANSSTTLSSSNTTAGTGMSVTLTAKVSSTGGIPSGSVNFLNGTTSLGSVTLDPTGTATLVTTFSTAGADTLTAVYSGTTTIAGSTSPSLAETVVTPSVSAAFNPGTLTIASGSSGTLTLTLTPANGYTGTVGLSCGANLPPHLSCSFAPASIVIAAGSGPVTDVLTINTAAQTAAFLQRLLHEGGGGRSVILACILPISFLSLIGLRRKGPKLPGFLTGALLLLLTLSSAAFLSGCGNVSPITPNGTYSVPVVLNLSGGSTQNLAVSITVD
jgi:uncharacterized repeat protein (TIGR03803 family)